LNYDLNFFFRPRSRYLEHPFQIISKHQIGVGVTPTPLAI